MILRFAPGALAPWSSTYALIDYLDRLIGPAVWCEKGNRLPSLTAVVRPHWFVPMFGAQAPARMPIAA
jgi:hypothetical protein